MNKDDILRVESWVFDLDNTLYTPQQNIFSAIDKRMTDFISTYLNIERDEAFRIQKHYWTIYGTTMSGLQIEHDVNPDIFLEFIHDVDLCALSPNLDLRDALMQLAGDKYIFTNGTCHHAQRIMTQLGVADCFTDIFDIRLANYVSKPNPSVYQKMLDCFDLKATEVMYFEDMARNLIPAHKMGMQTIWIRHALLSKDSDIDTQVSHMEAYGEHIDYVTDNLVMFLRQVKSILSC